MRIQTFSVVVGNRSCDANCPFCISKMTGDENLIHTDEINKLNFQKAVKFAQIGGCTTVLFTGKGEPLLPRGRSEISEYLKLLKKMGDPFPFIEVQTNGIILGEWASEQGGDGELTWLLYDWHQMGLNTISISAVDIDPENNKKIYLNHRNAEYPDLKKTVKCLHIMEFTVRLNIMMQSGIADNPSKVIDIINWCKQHKVEQLTLRPIRKPQECKDDLVKAYINEHCLDGRQEGEIKNLIEKRGNHISTLMHGTHEAKIYNVEGQNVCLTDCLTVAPNSDDIRTLIFYKNGRLSYDWQYEGATLL